MGGVLQEGDRDDQLKEEYRIRAHAHLNFSNQVASPVE